MSSSERYLTESCLGSGAYGYVTAAEDTTTRNKVALKVCRDVFQSSAMAKRILREVQILKSVRGHENVLTLNRVYVTKRIGRNSVPLKSLHDLPLNGSGTADFSGIDVQLVTNLMETDLACIVQSTQPLSMEHVQFFTYQIVRGLKYIHTSGFLHRDLKPRNLVVNSNCDLRICDFGLARIFSPEEAASLRSPPLSPAEEVDSHPRTAWGWDDEGASLLTEYVQTRWYRAPEVLYSLSRYTEKIDIWSVGCIMAELLVRKPVFRGSGTRDQLAQIVKVLGKPTEEEIAAVPFEPVRKFLRGLSGEPTSREKRKQRIAALLPQTNVREHPHCLDLLSRLLSFSPSERPSVEEILRHPFFSSLHDPADEPAGARVRPDLFRFEAFPSFFEERDWPIPRVDSDLLASESARGEPRKEGNVVAAAAGGREGEFSGGISSTVSKGGQVTDWGAAVEAAAAAEQSQLAAQDEPGFGLASCHQNPESACRWIRDPQDREAYVERLRVHPFGAFLDRLLQTSQSLEAAELRSLGLPAVVPPSPAATPVGRCGPNCGGVSEGTEEGGKAQQAQGNPGGVQCSHRKGGAAAVAGGCSGLPEFPPHQISSACCADGQAAASRSCDRPERPHFPRADGCGHSHMSAVPPCSSPEEISNSALAGSRCSVMGAAAPGPGAASTTCGGRSYDARAYWDGGRGFCGAEEVSRTGVEERRRTTERADLSSGDLDEEQQPLTCRHCVVCVGEFSCSPRRLTGSSPDTNFTVGDARTSASGGGACRTASLAQMSP
uniref:Protein kinase domain-containing protein n=1 Tax=Chromera velia CCMP2878 TaxID=1169474 RepID=A0A0G4G425_9ALVE|eukprot:Cvel_4121.t1-p1 / transcript=Cvel_4121.t1 / gene=Cvel_4121 / organism=Chromera_velia_CCMP2878 / gene_product=Extracellular signal-regulated kinase 1, putative / transcript_product=Extracellular signal-regulated kinase 1, putative / location=Cvel_scaffold176:37778-41505(-) / protein_length=775 / sequence_SO=supercontig / SO=protein_coding / is_pseudo=false